MWVFYFSIWGNFASQALCNQPKVNTMCYATESFPVLVTRALRKDCDIIFQAMFPNSDFIFVSLWSPLSTGAQLWSTGPCVFKTWLLPSPFFGRFCLAALHPHALSIFPPCMQRSNKDDSNLFSGLVVALIAWLCIWGRCFEK